MTKHVIKKISKRSSLFSFIFFRSALVVIFLPLGAVPVHSQWIPLLYFASWVKLPGRCHCSTSISAVFNPRGRVGEGPAAPSSSSSSLHPTPPLTSLPLILLRRCKQSWLHCVCLFLGQWMLFFLVFCCCFFWKMQIWQGFLTTMKNSPNIK